MISRFSPVTARLRMVGTAAACAVVGLSVFGPAAAGALPAFVNNGRDDATAAFDILAPGEYGSVPTTANSTDQGTLYDALTPLRGGALLAGQLGGALVVACIQSVVYLLVGIATGVGIASGVGGAFVLLALSILIAFGFAGLGALIALRSGSGEAVQAIFPLLFVTLFLSSASLPRPLIAVTWFRDVATYNPVSYLIEGIRSLVISGWDGRALALGFGFALALVIISMGFADLAMKNRLVRT